MTRALPEWRGKSDDSSVPPHVRLRIFQAHDGRCGCCARKIVPGEAWDLEHTIALVNGGEHRESNMRPWLAEHHKTKTRADLAVKSKTYRMGARHAGVRARKGRPMPGTRASGVRKRFDGRVERW